MLQNFCDSRQSEKKLQSGQFREGRSGYRKQKLFFFFWPDMEQLHMCNIAQ